MMSRVNMTELLWQRYVKSGCLDGMDNAISPMIRDSWKRCRETDVEPQRIKSQCLGESELKSCLESNQSLIKVAIPFMEKLYSIVRGSSFAVVLLDNRGYILHLIGDCEILERFPFLKTGEDWSEAVKGTNAMGLVYVEQKPLQVFASEHYCKPNKELTCSAAPIEGEDGNLVAVLDMSGDYRQAHAHTLGMVVAAVQAISNQMKLEKASTQILHSYKQITAIMESVTEGIVAFDRRGIVTGINSKAVNIIGEPREKLVDQPSLGRLFATSEVAGLLEMATIGKPREEREITVNTKRKQLYFTVSGVPIYDGNGMACGGVVTLRETRAVRELVTHMVGARAYYTFDSIIGESKVIQNVIKKAKTVARNNSSILLSGESGTGKEMFAQAIHNFSTSSQGPFVAVNCAAIPRELVESELFGYEEGAFTGAKRGGRPGKFELANAGTIFLDEIGDMPVEIQVTLLRVLQERQVVRVGGARPIPTDLRVIAATSKNLPREAEAGRFRKDLFYRLSVIPLVIPPLRERGDDVIILAEHFLRVFSEKMRKTMPVLSPGVVSWLKTYTWPGNIRELSNVIEMAVNLADTEAEEIRVMHLTGLAAGDDDNDKTSFTRNSHTQRSIEDNQKQLILQTLRDCQGNMSNAAEILGIGRTTLYRKLRKYNIPLSAMRLY